MSMTVFWHRLHLAREIFVPNWIIGLVEVEQNETATQNENHENDASTPQHC